MRTTPCPHNCGVSYHRSAKAQMECHARAMEKNRSRPNLTSVPPTHDHQGSSVNEEDRQYADDRVNSIISMREVDEQCSDQRIQESIDRLMEERQEYAQDPSDPSTPDLLAEIDTTVRALRKMMMSRSGPQDPEDEDITRKRDLEFLLPRLRSQINHPMHSGSLARRTALEEQYIMSKQELDELYEDQ